MRTSATHPLVINEIRLPNEGMLGLTFAPGKQGGSVYGTPWHRNLVADLKAVKAWGADYVITLLEDHELSMLNISELPELVSLAGMKWIQLPITDVSIPDVRFHTLWKQAAPTLHQTLEQGGKLLIHCRGGLGRTGLVAAQILIEQGVTPSKAIDIVRTARPGSIETPEQEDYVRKLAARSLPPARTNKRERFLGCMLAGAIGDALGAPVEFMSRAAILAQFGKRGIIDYAPAYGRIGAITDDTQMTLFTAEGLLRAWCRGAARGICCVTSIVSHAYQRWLKTQGGNSPVIEKQSQEFGDGVLMRHHELFSRRAPGNTCLGASQVMPHFGEPADNDSKGCGGVMRVAPVGLFYANADQTSGVQQAFCIGGKVAELTHGHPTSTCASSAFAALICLLAEGKTFTESLSEVRSLLQETRHYEETLSILLKAEALAEQRVPPEVAIPQLGEGWIAEEALAIAVYSVLITSDLEEALIVAVNHDGDSDSTGAIAGNLAGTIYGVAAIPERWLKTLELKDVVQDITTDLLNYPDWKIHPYGDFDNIEADWVEEKYPGW